MQYIIDIVLVVIFIITVIISAKKGFFMTIFELGSYLISITVAKMLSATVAPGVYSSVLESPIKAELTKSFGDAANVDVGASIQTALNSIPAELNGIIELIGVNKDELIEKVSNANLTGANAINSLMDNIVSPVATAVIQTILFVICAIVIIVLLKIVIKLLNGIIKKLPAIKQVNGTLGALFGAVKGLIVVVISSLAFGVIASVLGSEDFVDMVNGSIIINSVKGVLASISGYAV